jgi:hypothetical protein
VASTEVTLPTSYLELLQLHDGIESFYWVADDLLSCAAQTEDPDHAKHWDRPQMHFFIMGDDFEGVAFDTDTRGDDGEMEVVEFAHNVETVRWPSLDAFLVGYRDRLLGLFATLARLPCYGPA